MTPTRATTDRNDAGGEEMLRLVQGLFLSTSGSAHREIVFCGVDSENGSSSVCASAGKTLAAYSSRSVCLVDANLRSPRLSNLFGVETPVFRRGPVPVRERCVEVGRNLWLAGNGFLADDLSSLPSVARLKQRLAELSEAFEFVLIDAPGAGISADAAILGQMVNGTVLVIDASTTRRIAARKAKEFLNGAGVRLLGAVLHGRTFPIPQGLYDRL
jgi:succinoglycan biosynthesis transport protein ExoP